MEDSATKTVDVSFHGVDYTVTITNNKDSAVYIEVEQKTDSSCWRTTFTAKQVEEITTKSGGLKKLPLFFKMLEAALRQQSESVFADLLTFADLEALRARKASVGPSAPANQLQQQNKRYLILTYAGEFDRIHYPLPLPYEDNPDPIRLKGIITRLRAQLNCNQDSSSSAAQVRQLSEENAILREQLRGLSSRAQAKQPSAALEDIQQESQAAIQELRLVREECELLRKQCQTAEADWERQRALQRRDLRRRAQEAAAAKEEAATARTLVLELQLRCRELEERCEKLKRRQLSPLRSRSSTRSERAPWTGVSRQSSYSAAPKHGSHSAGASPRRASQVPYSSRRSAESPRRFTSPGLDAGYASSHSQPRSMGSRPSRFDPTEYIRQRREKQLEAARRQQRFGSPGRATSSLPPSGSSTPVSRQKTGRGSSTEMQHHRRGDARMPPVPSRSVFRDVSPSMPRNPLHAQKAARQHAFGSSASSPRELKFRQQENLEHPPRSMRAASPSQALRDVKARLNSFVGRQSASSRASSESELPSPTKRRPRSQPGVSGKEALEVVDDAFRSRRSDSRLRGSSSSVSEVSRKEQPLSRREQPSSFGRAHGSIFGEACADITDIDSRLQSLQEFLRAAKAGSAVVS